MVVLGALLQDCMPPKSQGGGALLDTNKLLDQEIFIPNDNGDSVNNDLNDEDLEDGPKHKELDTENHNTIKNLTIHGDISSPNTG